MERMWRKVNQGLTNLSKTTNSTDTASSAGFGEVPNVAAVSSTRRNQHKSQQQHSTTTTIGNTASSERRRRRRKRSRPRRGDGGLV